MKEFVEKLNTKEDIWPNGTYFAGISFAGTSDETALLKQICKIKLGKRRRELAWSLILGEICETLYSNDMTDFISEDVFNYLLENEIELLTLGHLQLKDEWLLEIYKKDSRCIEALQTIVQRRMKE
jgi:hypothetical protein